MSDFSVADAGSGATSEAAMVHPDAARGKSLWATAWVELRRNVSVLDLGCADPAVRRDGDRAAALHLRRPTYADLARAREKPSGAAFFGMDGQGYDVYARTVYGARASILVGVIGTIVTTVVGGAAGLIAGFRGGWLDAVLARVGEIFFALPLLLGGILFLFTFPNDINTPLIVQVIKIVAFIALLGWPNIARLMRASVLQVKPQDYVQAARALGASNGRIVMRHILPNALAPVIVVATINLGTYIATEATLSFLGIGLQPPAVSWGIAISDGSALGLIRVAPHMLLFPSIFLSLTVLAFIMLGDAVRDALDPKLR